MFADNVNDCGPLFRHTFNYDLLSVNSIFFTWPDNGRNYEYHLVARIEDVTSKHQDRIKILWSVSYEELFSIIRLCTPHIIFMTKPIKDVNVPPPTGLMQDMNVTTIIYTGDQIRLDYLNMWFPALQYIYLYKFDENALGDNADVFRELRTLSCWYGNVSMMNKIKAPQLENIDVYVSIDNGSSNPELDLTKFTNMMIVRCDTRCRVMHENPQQLQTLQFYPCMKQTCALAAASKDEETTEYSTIRKNFLEFLKRTKPNDLILPPSSIDDIEYFSKWLRDEHDGNNFRLGVYVNDPDLLKYAANFNSLQIFDNLVPLKIASLRKNRKLLQYIPKDIDIGIMEKMFINVEEKTNLMLLNFNMFTDPNTELWQKFYKQAGECVFICSNEVILNESNKWPTISRKTKNRVLMINSTRDAVYLDLNMKPLFEVAKILREIYAIIPFKSVYIVMRNDDESSGNTEFAQKLSEELGTDKKLNIYKFDMPSKVLIRT